MLQPWQNKIKQCFVGLLVCPKADAIGWLTRGGPLKLPELPVNMDAARAEADPVAEPVVELIAEPIAEPTVELIAEPIAELIAEPIVELIAEPVGIDPPPPLDLHMEGGQTTAPVQALVSVDLPQALAIDGYERQLIRMMPQSTSAPLPSIGYRRQSTAGGALFAIDNSILEMGADYMRRIFGSMIQNRFDPFQRMPNGPMRSRSRSVDSVLATIHEVDDNA